MSNLINVDGSNDPSYRYQMPRLVSKVEGRGNGVKTVLVNCVDVAAALNRTSAQLTKFFGCELGAMTKYEEKIERCLVNGAFDNKILQEALTGYIAKFVLCPACNNPETVQELKGKRKSAIVYLNCKACGACCEADNTHKLITFIVKENSDVDKVGRKEQRQKKRNEKNKKLNSGESTDETVSAGSSADKSEVKKKKKKSKKKDDENGVSLKKDKKKSEKGKKAKKDKEAEVEAKREETPEDDESSSDSDNEFPDLADTFDKVLISSSPTDSAAFESALVKVVTAVKAGKSDLDLIKFVEEVITTSSLSKSARLPLLFFSIVHPDHSLTFIIEKLKLLKSLKQEKEAKQASLEREVELLLCLEESVVRSDVREVRDKMRKMFPVILKLLYDNDMLDEATITMWHAGKLDTKVYKHHRFAVDEAELKAIKLESVPVIQWFNDAESGSGEDEDEDETSD